MEKTYPFNLITEYVIQGYGITDQTPYEIEEIDARKLLTPWRIDLMAKWIYIDAKVNGWNLSYATELYKRHLDSFSNGTFCEPGNVEKTSFAQYIQVFDELIRAFQHSGFDEKKSLLPVGESNVLLDGAHRCACAAYFNQKVKIIRFKNIRQNFGCDFFEQRFLERKYLDRMALEYCRHNEKLFMACIWPAAKGKGLRDKAQEIIAGEGRIVYQREVRLNYRGLKSFITQIYFHQSWVGSFRDRYAGAEVKSRACYRRNGKVRMILFQCSDLETVVKMKEEIRSIFHIENHSVHISDNAEETRAMAELLLNPSSVFHMKYGKPERLEKINQSIENWKSFLKQVDGRNSFDYLADWRRGMAVFGIRDCYGLGGSSIGNMPPLLQKNWTEEEMTENSLNEILQDTSRYFQYQGIKFEMMKKGPIINIRHFQLYLLWIADHVKIYMAQHLKNELLKRMQKLAERKRKLKSHVYCFIRNILKKLGLYERLRDKLY